MKAIGFIRRSCGQWRRAMLALVCAWAFSAAGAVPLTFTVNSPGLADVPDVDPGDGVCETVVDTGACTLRAAIQESNAHVGADTIILQPNVTYMLFRVGDDDTALNGDLDILDSVTITSTGPAIIDANGDAVGAIHEGVFTVFKCIRETTTSGACATGAIVVTMSGITIQHGYSSRGGGGILNYGGTVTLLNCIVTANTSVSWPGGGIANYGDLTITGSIVSNNDASATNAIGGGIYHSGFSLTIDSTTITGNVTSGTPGWGGGIYSAAAKLVVKNSTVSGNMAALGGGGVYLWCCDAAVLDSTISGNSSDDNGGGVYCAPGSCGGLYNVTIAQNVANAKERGSATGGGLFNAAGATLSAANSIIAGNYTVVPTAGKPIHDPDQCSGTINSLGFNLLSDIDVDHCTINGSYNVASLPLGPLQNNGGPTKTHALPSGSPAIDAGNPEGCVDRDGVPIATDQRGVPRRFGSHCDAGAFEASDVIFLNRFEIGV